jgi:hypothetical protein
MMKTRGEILRQLAEFREPSEPLLDELRKFGWDSETEHFVMTQRHVHSILKRYLGGELTAEQVTFWAETFESRDDVAFGESEDGNLKEIVFRLANPEINDSITPDLAAQLMNELKP